MSFPQPSDYRPPIIPDGEVYDNPENGRSYYWTQIVRPDGSTGGYWTVVCESGAAPYVLKAGDTMTGALVMDNAGEIEMINTDIEMRSTMPNDGTGTWDPNRSRFGSIKPEAPKIINDDGTEIIDSTDSFGINFDLSDINTYRNTLKVSAKNHEILRIQSGEQPNVVFNNTIDRSGLANNSGIESGVPIKGIPTPDWELTPGDFAVNKQYVDERDELLRQDIIELEEEIDAIAPSLEYGNWEWVQPTTNLRAPEKGTFYLLDRSNQLTTEYKDTKIVVINNYEYDDPNDNDPVDIHTWADADPGELIQLFDAADPDFMLGKIVAVNPDTETGSSGTLEFVRIEIDLIQSSGVPNDNLDPVTGKYLSRVNIFKEPSGGNASDFVLKSGDTMEGPGPLMFKTAKTTYNSSSPGSGTAYVKFQNKYGSGTGVHEVNMFMGGGSSSSNGLCITGRPLHVSNTIYSSGQYKARSSSEEYKPSLYFASEEGQLRYNGYTKLTWKSDGIREMIIKSNDGDKGMVIKRDRSTTNRVEWSGMVDIDTSGTNRCIGELWYNKNDGVMYLRIS